MAKMTVAPVGMTTKGVARHEPWCRRSSFKLTNLFVESDECVVEAGRRGGASVGEGGGAAQSAEMVDNDGDHHHFLLIHLIIITRM